MTTGEFPQGMAGMTDHTDIPSAEEKVEPVAWRCFHCNEVFTDEVCAKLHFGESEIQEPLCAVTAERYREVERQLEIYRTESDETSKTFYALGAEHYREQQAAEERGYARGLADDSQAKLLAEREWQPIETAPWVEDSPSNPGHPWLSRCLLAKLQPWGWEAWVGQCDYGDIWLARLGNGSCAECDVPTHWQPLPAPPER